MATPPLRTATWFVTLVVVTLAIGVLVIIASLYPDFDVSLTIAQAPVWLTLWIGTQTTLGSVYALSGISGGLGSKAWHAQQVGIWLMMGGYSSYAIASIVAYPQALVHSLLAGLLAVLCVVRFLDLRRMERIALASTDPSGI